MGRVVLAPYLLVGLVACGRVGFAPPGAEPDANTAIDGLELDVPMTPRKITELSVPGFNDDHPALTADRLQMFFCSDRAGGYDIYHSTRPSGLSPWSPPVMVASLSDPLAWEMGVGITPDASAMMLTTDRPPAQVGRGDIWTATRMGTAWSEPVRARS